MVNLSCYSRVYCFRRIHKRNKNIIYTAIFKNIKHFWRNRLVTIFNNNGVGRDSFSLADCRAWAESHTRRKYISHKERKRNSLEQIVYSVLYVFIFCIWLCNKIGKLRMTFALAITSSTPNNLYNLSKRRPIAHGQHMFAPRPVEALFCHAKGNNNIYGITVLNGT